MKRLRRISGLVRDELSVKGHEQSCLGFGKQALSVEGVVYAIVVHSKIYVGQTIHSAFHRFQQHVWKTAETRCSGTPFHRLLFRSGIRDVVIFPLEKLPDELYDSLNKHERLGRFREIALARELFWIHRLTTQLPYGLNVVPSTRRRRRHKALKWRRVGTQPHHVSAQGTSPSRVSVMPPTTKQRPDKRSTTKVDTEVSGNIRTFAYRDFERRCLYLASRFNDSSLDTVNWAGYRRLNLWRMLRALQHKLVMGISENARKAIMGKLRSVLLLRDGAKRKQSEAATVIRVDWTAHSLQSVALKRIISEPEVMHLLPDGAKEAFQRVVVARKLVTLLSLTLRKWLVNFRNSRSARRAVFVKHYSLSSSDHPVAAFLPVTCRWFETMSCEHCWSMDHDFAYQFVWTRRPHCGMLSIT